MVQVGGYFTKKKYYLGKLYNFYNIPQMEFSGTKEYISTSDLTVVVNASIALEKPLLVKGEPGTGKTELAKQIATSLDLEIIEWSIKSTTKAQEGLYEYDLVSRLRDSQLGNTVKKVEKYIKKGKLWISFETKNKSVLLIDEIDKSLILNSQMTFYRS